jgi:hypothetical protein
MASCSRLQVQWVGRTFAVVVVAGGIVGTYVAVAATVYYQLPILWGASGMVAAAGVVVDTPVVV